MEGMQEVMKMTALAVLLVEAMLLGGALMWFLGLRQLLKMETEQLMGKKWKLLLVGIALCFAALIVWMELWITPVVIGWEMAAWVVLFSGSVLYTLAFVRAMQEYQARAARKAEGAALHAQILAEAREKALRAQIQAETQEKALRTQPAPEDTECALVETSYVTAAMAQRVLDKVHQAQEPVALQFEREWVTITCGVGQRQIAVYADCFELGRKAEPYYAELKTPQARTLLMKQVAERLAKEQALCVMEMKTDAAGCVVFHA